MMIVLIPSLPGPVPNAPVWFLSLPCLFLSPFPLESTNPTLQTPPAQASSSQLSAHLLLFFFTYFLILEF